MALDIDYICVRVLVDGKTVISDEINPVISNTFAPREESSSESDYVGARVPLLADITLTLCVPTQ